jgi:hypothetical protein
MDFLPVISEPVMDTRRWFAAAAVVCLTWTVINAVGRGVSIAQDEARAKSALIGVGKNVQVSADNANIPHYEVISCANPVDTRQMLAGVMTFQHGTFRTIVYRSIDGGDHWGQVLTIGTNDSAADPSCVFGPDGSAYVATLMGEPSKVVLYRSTDGGASWGQPIEQTEADRPYLSVDDTRGPFQGSLYYLGVSSTRTLESHGTVPAGQDPGFMTGPALFVSRNNGATFTGQMRVALKPQYALGLSNSVVLTDGSVMALLGVNRDSATPFNVDRRPARSLTAVRSTPGGNAIREGVKVSDWYLDLWKNDGSNTPALALDRTNGPFAGRLYAVWPDNRSGRSQILLSWSDSKGDSWSAPVVVDDDLAKTDLNLTPDAINPTVAVNQAGVVGVAWGDRREHSDNLGWRFRFAASLDGGDTFTPSVKLASATNSYDKTVAYPLLAFSSNPGARQPIQMRVLVMRFFYSAGDTVSMTIDQAGVFHPMWCDNRTGLSQLWTAPVTVAGSAIRNGSEQLASLDEVTSRIEAIVEAIQYDPARNRGELVIRLKNISPNVIAGPLKMRVLGLSGQLGTPIVLNDERDAGIFTLGTVALLPNERSSPLALIFSISSHHRPVPGHDFVVPKLQLLNIRLRVFGGRTNDK